MVGISYDPKIDSFLRQVNQPVIGSVDGDWSADDLYKIAKKQVMQHEEIQQSLQRRVDELQLQGEQAAQKIIYHIEKTLYRKSRVFFLLVYFFTSKSFFRILCNEIDTVTLYDHKCRYDKVAITRLNFNEEVHACVT